MQIENMLLSFGSVLIYILGRAWRGRGRMMTKFILPAFALLIAIIPMSGFLQISAVFFYIVFSVGLLLHPDEGVCGYGIIAIGLFCGVYFECAGGYVNSYISLVVLLGIFACAVGISFLFDVNHLQTSKYLYRVFKEVDDHVRRDIVFYLYVFVFSMVIRAKSGLP